MRMLSLLFGLKTCFAWSLLKVSITFLRTTKALCLSPLWLPFSHLLAIFCPFKSIICLLQSLNQEANYQLGELLFGFLSQDFPQVLLNLSWKSSTQQQYELHHRQIHLGSPQSADRRIFCKSVRFNKLLSGELRMLRREYEHAQSRLDIRSSHMHRIKQHVYMYMERYQHYFIEIS